MSKDLVVLLRRPYGNLTFAEKQAVADLIEEMEAKLAQQDDLVQAAVAAALREAAGLSDALAVEMELYNAIPKTTTRSKAICIRNHILALIPEDAQAALYRVVAAERERCAKVAEQKAGAGSHAIAGAIRKGGE